MRVHHVEIVRRTFDVALLRQPEHLSGVVRRVLARLSLRGALALVARRNPGLGPLAPVVADLLRTGALEREEVDGEAYLWPPLDGGLRHRPAPRDVRLLAPFDPLVWDRRRFEHLWGWAYRFEAYTPPPQRRFGYYAMPLLWADQVVGWANVAVAAGGLHAAVSYVRDRPAGGGFDRALDAELARLERFLTPRGRPVSRGAEEAHRAG